MCFFPNASTSGPATTPQDKAQRGWSMIGNAILAGQGDPAAKQRLQSMRAAFQAAHGGMTAAQVMAARGGGTGGPASVTGV